MYISKKQVHVADYLSAEVETIHKNKIRKCPPKTNFPMNKTRNEKHLLFE